MLRFTMQALAKLTLVTAVAFSALGAGSLAEEPSGLAAFADKRLTRLAGDEREKLATAFKELTGDDLHKPDELLSFQPFLVSKFAAGDAAWIFVEAYQGWAVPDVSGMQVHVFDNHWKRLFKQTFPTGYRRFLADVTIERNSDLGCDVLVGKLVYSVRSQELLAAGKYQRAHFARCGDRLELVRYEEADKTLTQLWYVMRPEVIIGPPPPQRTPETWLGSLRATDPVEQVAALVWISGRHSPSSEKRVKGVGEESLEQALAYEAVRDSKALGELLSELKESPTQLVRDYAQFAKRMLSQRK